MIESDRELLLWAAKAAGMQIDQGVKVGSGHLLVMHEGTPSFWNPFDDNDHAFSLAVKCGISVLQFPTCIGTRWPQSGINPPYEEISSGQDPLVATRRVIVRAAAEIGRNMP